MTRPKLILVVLCFFFTSVFKVSAQSADSITQKISAISLQLGLSDSAAFYPDVFLHLDKTVYLTDENIWFSAYLLNGSNIERHHTLHVVLVDDMTRKEVTSQSFVLEHGIGSGSFLIPDSLQSGEYSLMAYTNRYPEKGDQRFFRQPISLIGSRKIPFEMIFSGLPRGDSVLITGVILKKEGSLTNGTISYSVYIDGKLYNQTIQTIDSSGEIKFTVPPTYSVRSLEILGEVRNAEEKMHFKIPLNWYSPSSQILFFPEGGKLLDGQHSKVSFIIKSTLGEAISATWSLLQDGELISSFTSDLYGRGIFSFTPLSGKSYVVKLDKGSMVPLQRFPEISGHAWSLHSQSLVTDTLEVDVTGPSAGSEGIIVVHNNRQMLYGSYISLPKLSGRLRIRVKDWPKGLAIVCLYNKEGLLQSQRAILLKNENLITAVVQADSVNYHSLSKVTMNVKLSDTKGNPVRGLFSFSSILSNTLDSRVTDIERFYNYDRFLPFSSSLPPWFYLKQNMNVENILLYLQKTLGEYRYPSAVAKATNLSNDGYVLYKEKRLKIPINLVLVGARSQILSTDDQGGFTLPHEPLRGEPGSKVLLSIAKNPLGYRIIMDSPLKKINDSLAKEYFTLNNFSSDELSAEQKRIISSFRGIALQEVVVKAQAIGLKGYYGKINSSGNCNDYVCYLGFLNCISHPKGSSGTKVAVDGETYLIDGVMRTEKIVYHCQFKGMPPYIKSINATAYPEELYPFNITDKNLPEMLNRTTLHWQTFIKTDEKGEATISFYTNQRKGKFKGIIQGLSETGVISAEVEFNVIK